MSASAITQNVLTYLNTQCIGFLLVMYWLFIQLFLFDRAAINFSNDSPRYIEYANSILQGNVTIDFNFWYISYSLLIALVNYTGSNLIYLIIFQVLLSGLATLLLFRITVNIVEKNLAGYLAAFIYISWIYLQIWNYYITPESIFISICIFIIYLLQKSKTTSEVFLLTALLIFTTFLRPNGFCILLSCVAYFAAKIYNRNTKTKKAILLSLLVFIIGLLASINFMLDDYDTLIFRNYVTGEIISEYKGILIDHESITPGTTDGTLKKMISFFLANPWYLIKLSISKLLFFFAHIKPYYSTIHNIFIMLIIYPLYFFSIKFLSHKNLTEPIKFFFIIFILSQAFVVMSYMEDWDGRFLLPLLPVFIIAGTAELYKVTVNYLSSRKLNH